ncbi:hypothetical protein B296_00012324 [Ensete ventricosum]|uniref:Uncharacterized protein n=1 Tax=Ensete ventricosum TaxID=4639 RepID=A0A426YY62_ENSVE|nr:hypothetical protein B296_00012324 [Ensete ventricosum]
MDGVLGFPCLEGDLWLIFLPRVLLYDGAGVGLPIRCAISVRRWSVNDDVNLLLYQTMGAWERLSGPLHITLEISPMYELLNLDIEVMTFLCVMTAVSMEMTILYQVLELSWGLHWVGRP